MLKLTQLSGFGGARRATDFDLTIDEDTEEIDLRSHLAAHGYRNEPDVTVAIAAGVQVSSTTTAEPGLLVDLAEFPGYARIALTVRGEICGRGGASEAAGGTALEVLAGRGATLAVDNRGQINGGGGGGARGSSSSCRNEVTTDKGTSCGSTSYCSGGAGGTGYGPNAATRGSYGSYRSCDCGSCQGRRGSSGGDKGQAGGGGSSRGAAGAAVVGNANIEWTYRGVRNGTVS